MFDLIFNGMAAFQQAGMLLAGGLCFAIGALILGNGMYWRLGATRVEGTIIGVRKKDAYYYPVYRYMLPSGEERESTSSTGTGSMRSMDTGRVVRLMVFPGKPEEARPTGSVVYLIAGVIFLVPGGLFLHAALFSFPVNGFTLGMLGLFAVMGVLKIKTNMIPGEKRGTLAEWRRAREAEHAKDLANIPVRTVEEFRASPEGAAAAAQEGKQARFAMPLLLVFGAGMLWCGYHFAGKMMDLTEHGLRASGHVVALESSDDSDGNFTYHPVVEFKDRDGKTKKFRDGVGSSPPSYRVGEDVTVLYLADKPQDSATIDRGWMNWLVPGLMGGFGAVFVLLGLSMLLRFRDQSA